MFKDQLHFCIMAGGSLTESLNHLIDEEKLIYFKTIIDETERLLNGYIPYLRKNL